MKNRMNINKVILGAFGYVLEYRVPLTKALLFPITILVLLGSISLKNPGIGLVAPLVAIHLVTYSVIVITTHRIVLLGPDAVAEWGIYLPQKREFLFIMYSIGMGLFSIPFGFLIRIPVIGIVAAVIGIMYVMTRLSLVFPAIATDQRWSFADSWNATRKHQALMLVVVIIFPLVISIPAVLLSQIQYLHILVKLLSAVTMVLAVTALSVAFQVITDSAETDSSE